MPSETQTPGQNTFYIGLCMAGAVSAGAYTAGVMDYLIEALQEWQKRKESGAPDTPSHNVEIPVIGGASAGGMTGIITAAALNNEIKPVNLSTLGNDILQEQPQNKFYHSWVDLIAVDMFPLMLSTGDIDKSNSFFSLLNSDFIDQVAAKVVQADIHNWKELPPFFSKQLKIFTTLTNLEGYAYDVTFKAGIASNKYYMAIHNDYACFQLNTPGDPSTGWMPLDFKSGTNVNTAKDAAMATGAFPVGLKSRTVTRDTAYVNNTEWIKKYTHTNPVSGETYTTQNIDGGTINNEPFEKVRDVLTGITGQDITEEYESYNTFKSTVLMIDPFPSEKPDAFSVNRQFFATIGKAFSAIVGQMRAKPAELVGAYDSDNAGQYLIAPARKRPKLNGEMENVQGDKAIACGAFDGFSGFINKEFRVHDYFLGRFNCEKFLRNYFTIPEEAIKNNLIFKNGYSNIDTTPFKVTDTGGKVSYQIIPIFTPDSNSFPMPVFSSGTDWPVIEDDTVEQFRPLMKKRVGAILMNAAGVSGLNKFLLWAGAKLVLNKMLAGKAMDTIKQALAEHQLLKPRVRRTVKQRGVIYKNVFYDFVFVQARMISIKNRKRVVLLIWFFGKQQ